MKRYSAYKDSGVQWIGDVPRHWEISKIRDFFQERREKVSDKDFPPLSVSKMGIVPQLDTAVKTDNGDNRKRVCKGDFVVNSRSDRKGSCGFSEYDGSVSLINIVLSHKNINYQFYHYLFRSNNYIEEYYRQGRGIVADLWTTRYSEMKSIYIPVPPLSEQRAIVDYLKDKTSKIDQYVSERERERELLDSLKQSEIANVVTKGLNPNAKMKDSGIPWIGEIPEHWEVERLSRYIAFSKGLPITKANLQQSGIPVVSYGQIHSKENVSIRLKDCLLRFVSPEYKETHPQCMLKKYDFVFADTSEDFEGAGNFVFNDRDDEIFAGYHTIVVRLKQHFISPVYLAHLLNSKSLRNQTRSKVDGVKVFSITKQIIKSICVVVPPKSEQMAIVKYLDERLQKIDQYMADLQSEIDYLKEFKQRLISDAVTGQICVTTEKGEPNE